jgi:CheY-like chemotaxis protein
MPNEGHKRVLVVDDDEDVRRILKTVLEPRGLIVVTAADGREALDRLREQTYAVVILDMMMPHVDGFQVLGVLQSGTLPFAPVVLVLSGAGQTVLDRLDPQHIHGIVKKPFDPEEFAGLVLACSEVKGRGPFGPMAIATMISGAPLLAWLNKFGS